MIVYITGRSVINHLSRDEKTHTGINVEFGSPNYDEAAVYAVEKLQDKKGQTVLVTVFKPSANGDVKVERLDHSASMIIRPLEIGGIQLASKM